jgi:hypothetical protein
MRILKLYNDEQRDISITNLVLLGQRRAGHVARMEDAELRKHCRRWRKRREMDHEDIRLMELVRYHFQWRALVLADQNLRILLPSCYKIEYISALNVCMRELIKKSNRHRG